jgi:DNA-binding CsgD family transcriptional regulator
MPNSQRIKESDIRDLFVLLGECRELGDDPIFWRQHFYGQLAKMTGADAIAGAEMHNCLSGRMHSPGAVLVGFEQGISIEGLKITWEWNAIDPDLSELWRKFRPALAASSHGLTAARRQLLGDASWYRSNDYQMAGRMSGTDAVMHSFLSIDGLDFYDGIAFMRGEGQRQFDEREVALVSLVHQETTRLIGGALARFEEPHPSQLTSRVRQVLRCLLEGDTDKQIATRLNLSPHTVNQYTKQIFRHFGVTSRAELLARWIRRGWSSRAGWIDKADELSVLVPYEWPSPEHPAD